jgi:hypothetical protein
MLVWGCDNCQVTNLCYVVFILILSVTFPPTISPDNQELPVHFIVVGLEPSCTKNHNIIFSYPMRLQSLPNACPRDGIFVWQLSQNCISLSSNASKLLSGSPFMFVFVLLGYVSLTLQIPFTKSSTSMISNLERMLGDCHHSVVPWKPCVTFISTSVCLSSILYKIQV